MKAEAMHIWQQLTRWTQGIILIMVSILFFTWGILGSVKVGEQTERIVQRVEAQHVALEKKQAELLQIVIDNGEFQSCVWHEVIRPKNVGNQKRTVKAIRECEKRYL